MDGEDLTPAQANTVKEIEVEATVVHIHLEIPAWNNLISIINSCTNLNPERAVNSYSENSNNTDT